MSYVSVGATDPFQLFDQKLAELRQAKSEEDAGTRPPAPKSTINWWCWDTPGFKDCFPMAFRAAQADCEAQGHRDESSCINPLADRYAQGCPCAKEPPAGAMSPNTKLLVGGAGIAVLFMLFGGKKKTS